MAFQSGTRPGCEQIWWSALVINRGQAPRPYLLPHLVDETICDPGVHLWGTLARISQRLGMALQICSDVSRHRETKGVAAGPALMGAASGAVPRR